MEESTSDVPVTNLTKGETVMSGSSLRMVWRHFRVPVGRSQGPLPAGAQDFHAGA